MKKLKDGLINNNWSGDSEKIILPIYITRDNIRTTTNQSLSDEEWYLIRDLIKYIWEYGMFDINRGVLNDTIEGILKDIRK